MTSRLNYLLERYITKTCTESERQELAYLAIDPALDAEIKLVLEELYNSMDATEDIPEHKSESILHSILQPPQIHTIPEAGTSHKEAGISQREAGTSQRHLYLFTWKLVSIAASLILMIAAGTYYLFIKNGKSTNHTKDLAQTISDVKAPEANKAMIVLGNGKTVLLDSLQKQSIALQGDVSLIKTKDGQIQYNGHSDEMVYNTLVNPRGSKVINLTLQDGTRVWLNCESSLKYPISFEGKDRTVEIRGEAYFEVAKNPSKKFMVLANGVRTEVIGTHFNVNAYNDLGHTNITLLEGSIKVSNNQSSTILKPGQQALLNEESKIDIDNSIETNEIIAWKDGMFNFNSLPLRSIMKQIERWYDVDLQYDGENREKHFSGIFSRTDNISEIFKMMQLAGVQFKIEGKTIIVTE